MKTDDLDHLEDLVTSLNQRIEDLTGVVMTLARKSGSLDAHVFASTPPEPRSGRSDLQRKPAPPMPDPRLLSKIIRQRRLRARYFERGLFADPAWDILLDLCVARAGHRVVSVSSLCIAAAVPETTALRWITMMEKMNLLVRTKDPDHGRRSYIGLSEDVARAMSRYFDEMGPGASSLI